MDHESGRGADQSSQADQACVVRQGGFQAATATRSRSGMRS